MPTQDTVSKLTVLIRSGYKLIHFSTVEELRAEEQLRKIAASTADGKSKLEYYAWTTTDGFQTPDGKEAAQSKDTDNPEKALQWIQDRERKQSSVALYVFKDIHSFIGGRSAHAKIVRKLKDTVLGMSDRLSAVILLSGPQLEIPPELDKEIVIVEFDLPDRAQLQARYAELVADYRSHPKLKIDVTEQDIANLAKSAQGMTMAEADLALCKAITADKTLDARDVTMIQEEKKQIVKKSGILTVEEANDMNDVGGLEILKEWLGRRERIFSEDARKYGLPAPKGVLLTGVPGCGKSLCARAMADHWKIPILRLDMGAIFGGLVGASEANMRKAIACAKAMAPCVLMIDEIEKGLAGASGGGGDGGTSTRVFGTLLTWMSDKTEPVFIVATANEFDRLPPEMLRKGRFDELFFVDFPHAGERRSIFNIHVKKALRRREPQWTEAAIEVFCQGLDFDSEHTIRRTDKDGKQKTVKGTIVQLSNNFTGSEIEEAVKAAMIDAFADGQREFNSQDIAFAIARTVPLIDTMAARIEAIRARGREFTVSASRSSEVEVEAQVVESSADEELPIRPLTSLRGGRAMDI